MEAFKKIKQNIKSDAANAGLVFLGFVTGKAVNYFIDLAIEDKPDLQTYIKPIKPFVIAGAGLALSSANDKDSQLKYIGYGIAGAGASELIKIIPVVGEYAKNVLGSSPTDIPVYYAEGLQQIELGGFGISEIPLRTLSVQDANSFNPELPELEGVELGDINNIGISPTIPFVNAQSPLDESGLDDSRIL